MRKIILLLTVLSIFSLSASNIVLGEYICIDPGHGGPGASQYGSNGDGYGTYGPVYHLTEQWVNLQVALVCSTLLDESGQFYDIIMTRRTEQAEEMPWEQGHDATMWYRVNKANYGYNGQPVHAFVSIHHNGYTPYPGSQGTEVWWSSIPKTDSIYDRAYTDSTLAMKTQFRILGRWYYNDRCAYPRAPIGTPSCNGEYCCNHCCYQESSNPPIWDCCWEPDFQYRHKIYFVLRNTKAPAALSEASNLKDTLEEVWFLAGNLHIDQEAWAIHDSIYSYLTNSGIAIVRNSYNGGNSGEVIISKYDGGCFDTDTVSSPHTTCWLRFESYCLEAIPPSGAYTFHHWAHLNYMDEPVEISYDPFWVITVDWTEEYHKYVAYFTGGPYSAQVDTPNGYENWNVGEQRDIVWDVSIGADSTTTVYIYLDRNGGNDGYPEYLGARLAKLGNSFTWTVTTPYSTHCRVKVVAEDVAGNSAWDVSNKDFIISDSGNNNPVIDSHIQCKYPQEECLNCIQYGEEITIEILAHDPDGDSIFYEWWCPIPFGGHFSNGQKTMTTAQNYVTYIAPTKGKDEQKQYFRDLIHVTVIDVRGGQNWAEGDPELHDPGYTCICGDANGSGVIELGDIITLQNYLFLGYPASTIASPIERADPNNNCKIDLGDIVTLLNYLFKGYPIETIECCWFPPE